MPSRFTKHQLQTAIDVLVETDLVKNWALGELRAYGVSADSLEGKAFLLEQKRKLAERIVSQVSSR